MPHLPGGSVPAEIGEHPGEPVVDLVQGQLPVGGFQNGLQTRKGPRGPQSGPWGDTALCFLPPTWPLTLLGGGGLLQPHWTGGAAQQGCREPKLQGLRAVWGEQALLLRAHGFLESSVHGSRGHQEGAVWNSP